jgi:hypothetical protein
MNWFAPKCPVNEEERLWIEDAMRWLIEEFGVETIRQSVVVLPTEEFFPDFYAGREEDVQSLLNRVCSYMDVDPACLKLKFYAEKKRELSHTRLLAQEFSQNEPLGFFENGKRKFTIGIGTWQLNDPMCLVATIAHELGHVILLGENRVSPDEEDHESLTDLLTVFLGLGIFSANASFSFVQWTDTFSQGWKTETRGYLTEEIFGYALALFAFIRDEKNPSWRKYLTTNIESYFKNSLKYIEANQKSLLPELVSLL